MLDNDFQTILQDAKDAGLGYCQKNTLTFLPLVLEHQLSSHGSLPAVSPIPLFPHLEGQ